MPNDATLDFIRCHAEDDVHKLALTRAPKGVDLRLALIQIEGRKLIAHKLPTWSQTKGILFPPRLALEQCSSEATAAYKRAIVSRLIGCSCLSSTSFIDLTAGFGVDFVALAPLFSHAVFVDRQAELCELAHHNFPLLGLNKVDIRCCYAEDVLNSYSQQPTADEPPFTVLMIDPARRDAIGRKVALIEDCTPDVCALQDKLRSLARYVVVKLSPMLDLTSALRSLRGAIEAHVVGVDGECKELLIILTKEHEAIPIDQIPIHVGDSLLFTRAEEAAAQPVFASRLGTYLYEPNASILKAGAFRTIGLRYSLEKLAPQTHLYTSDHLVTDFPGRIWCIAASTTFAKRELREFLRDVPAADLTLRGFPSSVTALRHQLHIREGGNVHLLATTLANNQRLLLRLAPPHI